MLINDQMGILKLSITIIVWCRVDNDHSMVLEENTVSGLLDDNDNTGTAHQDENGNQFQTTWPDLFLVHLAQTDWCYQNCDTDELTDSRDGNVYRTVTIGSQTWMAENLRYLPFVHTNAEFATAADNASPAYGVYGYNGTDVQEATAISGYQLYGVLYNWYALQENICPAGWHIPTASGMAHPNRFGMVTIGRLYRSHQ